QGSAELFSQFPSPDRTGKCNWFSHRQNREGISTRKLNVRVFTQPGSLAPFLQKTSDYRGRDASYLAPPAQIRTGPIRAYGLYGAFFVKVASRHFGRPLHFILFFDPRCEHSSVPTAYFHRRRAQRRSRTALLQRRRRLVLDGR